MKRKAPWGLLLFCATVLVYCATVLVVGIVVRNGLWIVVNAVCLPIDAFLTVHLARQCAKARRTGWSQ